ncbi:F-actin-uncapping protein LRRC16A isoform X2 [Protopterus annectens]|uniref:F-actin-uncapping protein LRRC16A isoform X2 n=1 Tax=Protopterus annectens TaxID=7888 RepID=UPI001CFA93E6|nr:F-actin-uncapping protein LRRC16A isoform X2 [Protopterus annectens]
MMTEETSDVPKELIDSVRDALGRKIKIAVKKRIRLEIKGDKVENKVLVLASCRAFLLTARIPTKLEVSFSYLEIQSVSSCKPGQLTIDTEKYSFSMKMATSEDVNEVVAHIGTCLRKIVPGLSPLKVMKKVTMEPAERLTNLQALWESQTVTEPGPCGGFSQMYACVCDCLGFPYREEVQWDVDTIYLTQDTRELNLQDFSHLDHRDLIPIVAALEYNQWFTKLSTKDLKLSSDVCDQILKVVSRSSRLEELVLDNAGLRMDFAQKLANALSHNPSSALQVINLANNPLEDRGVSYMSAQFAKLSKGLKQLNLSKTSLTSKGVNSLAQSLSANQLIPSTLTHLDLSGNVLRGDDSSALYNFLSQPNAIIHLDLSNTDCSVDTVCGALCRGCIQNLRTLNLSRNVFSYRKGKEVPPSLKMFFSSAQALAHANMSGTKLAPETLKALLLGLACNQQLKEVSVDLSSCELRSAGGQILEGCIAEIHNISSLDISDNGLEADLATLIVWLSKNRSIRHLALGKNFNNIKSKNLAPVLDNLVHMIQDEDSPLQSLSLADSKLKTDLTIILNALGSNTSLTKLDISGNGMGDMGAKMLAKALQINTKLRTVIWDKNNISAQGFQDIAVALEKNYTLRFMPIPINDASQALKTNPEKTEEALQKIENYLLRNHETRKFLQEQAYRLQQGIITSTTQQMIDRMCVKVQDHLNSLKNFGTDAVIEDVKLAENIMKDAKNSKTLLPKLYHLGGASWAGANGSLSSPIQQTLESMAGEVTRVVDEQLKTLLESMVDAADGLCPHVMKKANLHQDLIEASTEKISIPRTFVTNVLLEQSGIDILNKISEVKLTVASFLSDRIVDEILEALSSTQHKLADHLIGRGKSLPHQESLEIEVIEDKPTKRTTVTSYDLTEFERLEELDSCMTLCCTSMTPKSKRKSIHSRMLRPVSRAFEMEFDLDKALEEIPIHVEDVPCTPTKHEKRPPSAMPELPSEEAKKLEHFTKLRPKRNRKQLPSKAAVSTTAAVEGEQNGLMGRVDEGVDEFFTKKITRMDTKKSLRSLESQECTEGEEKKKRDSRKSGFLNLIKSRSSKSDRPPPTVVNEEPASPKSAVRSPAPDVNKKELKAADHNGSAEQSEELKTPDSLEEHHPEEVGKSDSKSSPQGGRRYGVQVIGSGLLAEMKAKQEKRAAFAHKENINTDHLDGSSAEKTKTEPKTEPGARPRTSSNTTTSPKPPIQATKPSTPIRPTVPLKPRSASRTEDIPDSPSGQGSPKAALVPSLLKKVSTDKEKDGQSSSPQHSGFAAWSSSQEEQTRQSNKPDTVQDSEKPASGGKITSRQFSTSAAEEVSERERRKSQPRPVRPASMSEDSPKRSQEYQQSTPEEQDRKKSSNNKNGQHGNKSSDSGEEVEKEFIFI